jgi:hypothetical protein
MARVSTDLGDDGTQKLALDMSAAQALQRGTPADISTSDATSRAL